MATIIASDSRRVKAIGSFTELVFGAVSATAGESSFTIPQLVTIEGFIANGVLKDMVIAPVTTLGNVVTIDNESGSTQIVSYIAWGKGSG